MDDLIDYCTNKWFDNKPLPSKAVIGVKAYKNQADTPLTGTEYVFSAEYLFQEKDRIFVFSSYAGSAKNTDLSNAKKELAKNLRVFELFGIECIFERPELENLFKR